MGKRIHVTGDLVKDHYILKYPTTPSSYHEPSSRDVAKDEFGGVLYLIELIRRACSDLNSSFQVFLY